MSRKYHCNHCGVVRDAGIANLHRPDSGKTYARAVACISKHQDISCPSELAEFLDISTELRLSTITDWVVEQAQKQMRSQRRRERFAVLIWRLCHTDLSMDDDDDLDEEFYTIGRSSIFDVTNSSKTFFRTGLRSQASIDLAETCDEHFHPRRISMKYFLRLIDDGIDFEGFRRILFKAARVHITTKEENERLNTYWYNNPDTNWREAYKALGIVLVYEDGTIFDYNTDDIPSFEA